MELETRRAINRELRRKLGETGSSNLSSPLGEKRIYPLEPTEPLELIELTDTEDNTDTPELTQLSETEDLTEPLELLEISDSENSTEPPELVESAELEKPEEALKVQVLLYDNELYIHDAEDPIVQPKKFRLSSDRTLEIPSEEALPEDIVSELEKYNITEPTLTNEQKTKLLECLKKNEDVFSKGDYDLGCCTLGKGHIDTGTAKPIKLKPHGTPQSSREYLKNELENMIKMDIITVSSSPWAAPILMVKKKDGSLRLCIDYRELNKVVTGNSYPLPRIDDILSSLRGKMFFTSMDMVKGFWQIALDEESQEKTAFITPFGQYQFKRVPFGLMTSPSIFQGFMDQMLHGYNWECANVYVDDVLIFSATFDEHITQMDQIFDRMRKANMKAKLKKCEWARTELLYLGHIINRQGILVDPAKVEAVTSMPPPTCFKDIETFFGKANYYAKFIPDFSEKAKPLLDLKKNAKNWNYGEKEEESFQALKRSLCEAPVLKHPDLQKEFLLSTDASGYALGAVLSQEFEDGEHPIAYASRLLKPEETRYAVIEREAMAIWWAVNHFREYVEGCKFTIYTDHKPLTYFRKKHFDNTRLANYALKLQNFDFEIIYRKGEANGNADCLSRYPIIPLKGSRSKLVQTDESVVNDFDPTRYDEIPKSKVAREPKAPSLKSLRLILAENLDRQQMEQQFKNIRREQRTDPLFDAMMDYLEEERLPENPKLATEIQRTNDKYLFGEERELRRNTGNHLVLCIPESLRKYVFYVAHEAPGAGHVGILKTVKRAQDRFWWPQMAKHLADMVQACPACTAHKAMSRPYRHPLGKRETPTRVWERVHFDVWAPGNPNSRGKNTLVAFVDAFSKYLIAVPTNNHQASTIAEVIVNHVAAPYGVPTELFSDGAPEFRSAIQSQLLQALGVVRTIVSPYRPQANGQAERVFRFINPMIAAVAEAHPNKWQDYIPLICHAYNTSYHRSINNTPFYVMFGRDPNPLILQSDTDEEVNAPEVRSHLEIMEETRRIVHENLTIEQERSKEQYDKKARPYDYQVGDVVMAKCPKVPADAIVKLYPKYLGPYRVKSVQFGVLGLVPLQKPDAKPKPLHSDRCRPCFGNTALVQPLEDLELPFQDAASVDPNLEPESQE
jgi:hypothetical protein